MHCFLLSDICWQPLHLSRCYSSKCKFVEYSKMLYQECVFPALVRRPMENSPPSPVFFKAKKTHEVSQPSQNGECAPQRPDRKRQHNSQQQQQQQGPTSDTEGSESDGGSLPPPFPEEDPERMKHSKVTSVLLYYEIQIPCRLETNNGCPKYN